MTEAFFLGYPEEFNQLCLVYPPKVKEIVANKESLVYIKLLTLAIEDLEDEKAELQKKGIPFEDFGTDPFIYLLNNAEKSSNFEKILKKAFYFFTKEDVNFLYKEKVVVLGDITKAKNLNELRILREEDFFEFQNALRASIARAPVEKPNPLEDPRVRAIKAKARERDRIKAKKGKGLTLKKALISLSCMGLGLNPLNIGELPYCAVFSLIPAYQGKEEYELEIKSLLAGADSKKVKPKYWITRLEEQ